MGSFTTNYSFFMPEESDSMADVKTNITDNFRILEDRNDITVVAAGADLPQAGDYELGDRVFRNDAASGNTWPSNYILICKDATWGWHWRPIQQIISPWVSLPSTIIQDASFEIHPTIGLQVALDSRGVCHWRGAIRRTIAGISQTNTTLTIFHYLPEGLRPNTRFMHTTPISPVQSGAGKTGYVGGRIYLQEDGYNSFRFFNTNNGVSQNIWLTGLSYANSAELYYNA